MEQHIFKNNNRLQLAPLKRCHNLWCCWCQFATKNFCLNDKKENFWTLQKAFKSLRIEYILKFSVYFFRDVLSSIGIYLLAPLKTFQWIWLRFYDLTWRFDKTTLGQGKQKTDKIQFEILVLPIWYSLWILKIYCSKIDTKIIQYVCILNVNAPQTENLKLWPFIIFPRISIWPQFAHIKLAIDIM
jgi:hypothetical protein